MLKDRTWSLNGKVFRWSDKASYDPGGFSAVAKSLQPHFAAVQRTATRTKLQPGSSETLFDTEGNGEFYRNRERKEALSAEVKAYMDQYWAGTGKEDRQMRLLVADLIFGVKSPEARDRLPLEKFERGLRVLQAFEKIPQKDIGSQEAVAKLMADCIAEYDRGESEEWDIPF